MIYIDYDPFLWIVTEGALVGTMTIRVIRNGCLEGGIKFYLAHLDHWNYLAS